MVEGDEPVSEEWLASGIWEVDIAGTGYPAMVSLTPLYDPGMKRARG
jgi:4-methylaminobutanoate oxidase (formaldehyde-forming)